MAANADPKKSTMDTTSADLSEEQLPVSLDTMSTVQVNYENGDNLGKVKTGETKLQALERLSLVGAGGLYDKDDVGLLHNDCLTYEEGPYVFKPPYNGQLQVATTTSTT